MRKTKINHNIIRCFVVFLSLIDRTNVYIKTTYKNPCQLSTHVIYLETKTTTNVKYINTSIHSQLTFDLGIIITLSAKDVRLSKL